MIYFASGVFAGWKHESFGQCFLDYAWLIDEELPKELVGGGSSKSSTKRKKKPIKSASRDERDLMEMLTIITSLGIICDG